MDEREPMTAALLYAMARGLNQETVSALTLAELCGGDFPALLRFAKRHSVSALTGTAIIGAELAPEVVKPWRAAVNAALKRAVLFDAERREILAFLEASGVWHMPLKGVILQDFYPAYGLREMSDNDILHDPDAWRTVRAWMLARGYRQATPSGKGKDISYTRPPMYHFEMHAQLFSPTEPLLYAYYQDIKTRLLREPGAAYGYRFSDEDFYVYLLAHAYHHFRYAGIGLRTLADMYAYRRAKAARMDTAYLRRELDALGLTEFETRLDGLSRKLLSRPAETAERFQALEPEERTFLEYLSASGTHGTDKGITRNLLKDMQAEGGGRASLWGYCLARLRIAAKRYEGAKESVPAALYPLYLGGSLTRDAIRSRKNILRDIRLVRRETQSGDTQDKK